MPTMTMTIGRIGNQTMTKVEIMVTKVEIMVTKVETMTTKVDNVDMKDVIL